MEANQTDDELICLILEELVSYHYNSSANSVIQIFKRLLTSRIALNTSLHKLLNKFFTISSDPFFSDQYKKERQYN